MQSQFYHFTLKSLYRRRKSLRLPILVCSMTVASMLIISTLYSTIQFTINEYSKTIYGYWNLAVYNTTPSTSELLHHNALVDQIGTMTLYGAVDTLSDRKVNYIGYVDTNARAMLSINLEQGHYPENSDEIALEKELLLALGIDDTLGSDVTLGFTCANGKKKQLSFRLCGIINSYHNNYLKQGPLVSAFVSYTYHKTFPEILYKNNFVTLKDGYNDDSIVSELHNSANSAQSKSVEKWYYNTYIETPSGLPYTTFIIMLGFGVIMLAIIYHCFLHYYLFRFQILSESQLLSLDTKRILTIFRQETIVIIIFCFIIGYFEGSIILFALYKIAYSFYPHICFSLSLYNVVCCIILSLLCLILGTMISRIHSYAIITKKPTLHLPSCPAAIVKQRYHGFLYLIKRIVKVYKRTFFYYLVLYTIATTTIFLFSTSAYNTFDCVRRLRSDTETDYSIKKVTNMNSLATQMEQIKKLSEVDHICHYEYAIVDSVVLVKLPDKKNAPADNFCYVSNPATADDSALKIQNHVLTVHTKEKDYALTIKHYYNRYYPNSKDPLLSDSVPYVYCNSDTFNTITDSTGMAPYTYVKISYKQDSDPYVVTNIIDSILFGDKSIVTIHNALQNEKQCNELLIKSALLNIFYLFTFLTSASILRNQQKADIQYLQKGIKISWYLGLDKSSIKRYFRIVSLLLLLASTLISILITTVYWRSSCGSYLCSIDFNSLYMIPSIVSLSFLLVFMYWIVDLYFINRHVRHILSKF